MSEISPPAPRGARISPDRPFVGVLVILLVLVVMLAAMAFSFIALYEAAAWTHNPKAFWWLAPVIIDGPILVYTASYAIWRWRDIVKFAHHSMRALIFFTGLSVVVNALHVASGWEWAWQNAEMYGGVAMAAVAPIGALLAAHEVTRLVFMNHDEGDGFEPVTAPERAQDEWSSLILSQPASEPDAPAAKEPEAETEPVKAPARPSTSLLFPKGVAA